MLKYGIVGAVFMSELNLIFKLLKATFMGFDITIGSGFIVVTGFNLVIYFLLRRLPIKWERFDPKKLAKKMLRID
jgi:hypothetical protein